MIGGIAVDYYYAVDMGAVKGLVNTIGGVDFDIDIGFDLQGREYKKGLQHMDGQAVFGLSARTQGRKYRRFGRIRRFEPYRPPKENAGGHI